MYIFLSREQFDRADLTVKQIDRAWLIAYYDTIKQQWIIKRNCFKVPMDKPLPDWIADVLRP